MRRADLVDVRAQIFNQLSNERGTRLYKLQKRFQAVFGFTLRASLSLALSLRPIE